MRNFIQKKQKSYKIYTLDPYYNPITYKQNRNDQRSKKEKQKRGKDYSHRREEEKQQKIQNKKINTNYRLSVAIPFCFLLMI